MRDKFKVGIVGTGHGVRTIAPALLSTNEFEIVAISGSSISRAKEVGSESLPGVEAFRFEDILNLPELDLLCIASPNEFHAEHMTAAAKVETNLYLEKPIGNSLLEAERVKTAISNRPERLLTVVGHQLRFNPFLQEIKKKWRAGSLGSVYSVVIRQRGGAFSSAEKAWTWEFEKSRGGGVRLAMGTHLIDLVNFLSNSTPTSTFVNMDAVHKIRRPDGEASDRPVNVSNFFSASLDYGDFEAYVTTSAASHGPGTFEIEVLGSEGAIHFDGLGRLSHFVEGQERPSWFSSEEVERYQKRPGSSIFRKSLSVLAEEMAKSMRGQQNSLADAASVDDGVELLRILDAAMNEFNSRHNRDLKLF